MAIKIQIPTPMRQHADGKTTVEVAGATVQAALADLSARYPAIAERVFKDGKMRQFINVYLNNEDIRYLDNLATPVKDGDELAIIPAVSGG